MAPSQRPIDIYVFSMPPCLQGFFFLHFEIFFGRVLQINGQKLMHIIPHVHKGEASQAEMRSDVTHLDCLPLSLAGVAAGPPGNMTNNRVWKTHVSGVSDQPMWTRRLPLCAKGRLFLSVTPDGCLCLTVWKWVLTSWKEALTCFAPAEYCCPGHRLAQRQIASLQWSPVSFECDTPAASC